MGRSAVLLLGLFMYLFLPSYGQLGVRLPGATNFFTDPGDIVVGVVSDLEVQVECANMTSLNGSGTYIWMYGNGTQVMEGLQALGISQGGGVLRAYPASELNGTNNFICSESQTNSTINVTFNLVDSIFFTSPVPLVADVSENIVNLCPLPDIPEAMVTVKTNGSVSYCDVTTRRGNFRSVNIITNGTEEFPSRNVSFFTSLPEILRRDGQSQATPLQCTGDDLFLNGTLTDTRVIQTFTRSDAGIYQCLTTPEETSTALVYIIVAYLEQPVVSTAAIDITLGLNSSNITLTCMVNAHPLPRVTWTFDTLSSAFLQQTQAVTGFMEPARSMVMLDVASLTIGTHVIVCKAEEILPTLILTPVMAMVEVNVSVIFQDLSIAVTPTSVVLGNVDEVTVTCMITSSLEPRFNFSRNGMIIETNASGASEANNVYRFVRNINTSSFSLGEEEMFSCSSFLDVTNAPPPMSADASVSISVIFQNLSIAVTPPSVDLGNVDTVTITCMVMSSLEPRFSISRNGMIVETNARGISNVNNVYQFEQTINTSSFLVGEETFSCSSFLDVTNAPSPMSVSTSVNVSVLFENISLISSADIFILGDSREINVTCSIASGVTPAFQFFLNGERLPNTPAPTRGSNQYSSTVVLTMSDLSTIGVRTMQCVALAVGLNASASVNINVTANVGTPVLTDNVEGRFVLTDPLDGNLTMTCIVESSVNPTFVWTRNGQAVNSSLNMTMGMIYSSILVIEEADLIPPLEEFQCTTSTVPELPDLSATRNVTVEVVFTNIDVSPSDQLVNLSVSPDVDEGVVNLTCMLNASLLPNITWTQDGELLPGATAAAFMGVGLVSSQLTVNASMFRGEMMYMCTASLEHPQFNGSLNATATITTNVFPAILESPVNVTVAVAGDNVSLSCSAEGFPSPIISWQDGAGVVINENAIFTISTSSPASSSSLNNVTTSTLMFVANSTQATNESQFLCVAVNLLPGNDTSAAGQLLIAGPPLSPSSLNVSDIMARNATFSWVKPFSLIDITEYVLNFTEVFSDSNLTFVSDAPPSLGADNLMFASSSFSPFSNYSATLQAVNRAGISDSAIVEFTTSESIPGPPVNLVTSAVIINSINVSWDATPLSQRNGILTSYTIQYRETSGGTPSFMVVDAATTRYRITELTAGTSYAISIAANTSAGMGDFVIPVNQMTIANPSPIPAFVEEAVDITNGSSVRITLPRISSNGMFSHYWIIAMKVEDSFDSSRLNPKTMFPNNESFMFYSESIPMNTPYIAAEISQNDYAGLTTFNLGDNSSLQSNEVPKYVNGRLTSGQLYTAFVWGFAPVPMNGRAKRQTVMRQYMSFSSSPFVNPFRPINLAALSSGVIAAIVVVIVVVLLLVAAIAVVIWLLCERWRYNAEIGPPPSRKGSMRLRDANEIIKDPLRSGSFRVSRGGTLRSSFRAAAGLTLRNPKIEAELEDLNPDDARLPVKSSEFAAYVKGMHKNTDHLFSEEYEIITIKSPSLPHVQCSLPANVNKNRYANINCYDNSRVVLQGNINVIGTDYINANYIDGYKRKDAFIAAQGPLANTTHDFWRMVWEQESCCIVMLTNLVEKTRTKCHQYWPEVGSMSLGDITITLIEIQDLAYYTIRTFRVSRGSDTREVKQFHYTGWPDFGVPDYPSPVISFIKRVQRFKRSTEGPDIIHCSAGVGRTGTFVTIQCIMEMLEDEGQLDIFNFVMNMRHQRNYMVQTERQYIFIHDTLLEHIHAGNTEVSIQDLRRHYKQLQDMDPDTECSQMENEYGNLAGLQDIDTTQYHPAQLSVNQSKNRYPEILPYDRYRVRLLLHPGVVGSDYINASYLDGYHRRHQYIVTQGPMNNTVTDFWRMVWEHRCSCIMMLCPLEEKGKEQSVCYWPTDKVRQHGDMFIEQVSISKFPSYTMREIAITNTKINESRSIKHFHYDNWLENQAPSNATEIIDLMGVLQKTQNMCGGGPIIVHDNTGIGRGGAFIVLSSVLEQLKVEGIIDPFFSIHSLRQQQPGLVTNFEQYRFIYQAVMEFLDSFDHYANFD